jgi:excisionase family DNA binding protein
LGRFSKGRRNTEEKGEGMEITARLLNVGQAADYVGVSAASLRKWSNDGLVAVYRTPGGQRRYHREDLDRFMSSMREASPGDHAVPRLGRGSATAIHG